MRHLETQLNDVNKSRDQLEQEMFIKEEIIQQLRHEIDDIGRKNLEVNSSNNQEFEKVLQEVSQLDQQLNATRFVLLVNFKSNLQ